jgi:hypothetical protein
MFPQMPHPRPLLAQVEKLKMQAQGMRDLMCLMNRKLVEEHPLDLEADPVAMTPRRARKSPDLVQVMEDDVARLLTDDVIQAANQVIGFAFELFAQVAGTIAARGLPGNWKATRPAALQATE